MMGRGLKPATMEIFLRATLRVVLDDAREFAKNMPARISKACYMNRKLDFRILCMRISLIIVRQQDAL